MAVAKRENLFHFNYLYLFLKHFFLNGPGLSPPLHVCGPATKGGRFFWLPLLLCSTVIK